MAEPPGVQGPATCAAARVGELLVEARHTVMAPVLDADPREVRGRRYMPRSIEMTWKRNSEHSWMCFWIVLYGPQIRGDGAVGSREIRESIWFRDGKPETSSGHPLDDPCPPWALDLYWATAEELGVSCG